VKIKQVDVADNLPLNSIRVACPTAIHMLA